MARNLRQQLRYAIANGKALGHSKRSAKFDLNRNYLRQHIFGQKHYRDLDLLASRLGRWITESHPEIRFVHKITHQIIQEYVNIQITGSNDQTLSKLKSYLVKIEELCKAAYPYSYVSWDVKHITIPVSTKTNGYHKTHVMDRETSLRIVIAMRQTQHSNAWIAVDIGGRLGLRVEEASMMKIERFHFHQCPENTYGYGFYDLQPGDGSKGNRPRIVPIHTAEDRDRIQEILFSLGRSEGYVCTNTRYKKPTPLNPESIARQIARGLKELSLPLYESYLGDKLHSWRKMYARETYDLQRRLFGASKERALEIVNTELGHSGNRRELNDVYVGNGYSGAAEPQGAHSEPENSGNDTL